MNGPSSFTLAATLLVLTSHARAQSCCSGSSTNEFGIVMRDQEAVVGTRFGFEVSPWYADGEGQAGAFEDSTALAFSMSAGVGVRLFGERLQLQGVVPLRFQYRSFGELEETGAGLGDAALNVRFAVFEDEPRGLLHTGNWAPFFEPYVGVRLPSGKGPEDSDTLTLVDVTGSAAWFLVFGTRLSRALTESDVLFFTLAYAHPFARSVRRAGEDISFTPGEELTFSTAYLHQFDLFWSVGGSVDVRASSDARSEGESVPGSAARRLSVGALLSYFIDWPRWQLRASTSLDPPIDSLSLNQPLLGVSGGLSLERHFPR